MQQRDNQEGGRFNFSKGVCSFMFVLIPGYLLVSDILAMKCRICASHCIAIHPPLGTAIPSNEKERSSGDQIRHGLGSKRIGTRELALSLNVGC